MQRQIFHAYSDKEQVQQNMKYNIQDRERNGTNGSCPSDCQWKGVEI